MKQTIILTVLLVALSGVHAFAQKQPATAREFFAQLPAEYMTGTASERLGAKDKRGYILPRSVKPHQLNFLLFEGTVPKIVSGSFAVPQSMGQLKLYRGTDRTIVGLSFQVSDQKEANPTTDKVAWHIFLLEYKNGQWANVTDALLPKVTVDEAFKVLTEDFQMKDVNKDDVRVEAQLSLDRDALLFVAKRKGDDSVTILKWFKWTGREFVAHVYEK